VCGFVAVVVCAAGGKLRNGVDLDGVWLTGQTNMGALFASEGGIFPKGNSSIAYFKISHTITCVLVLMSSLEIIFMIYEGCARRCGMFG
jgi:hypothetical protein